MATSSMKMAMSQIHRSLPRRQQTPLPPAILTRDIQKKTPLPDNLSSEMQQELTMISHFGYGALGGIVFAALSPKISKSPLLKGTLFGLGVWAGSYYGLTPSLGLAPQAKHMTKSRNAMMILAHIVWGASLAYSEEELRTKGQALLDGRGADDLH
jgi:uncharacterized membrane protein YagU involved in acid resistance